MLNVFNMDDQEDITEFYNTKKKANMHMWSVEQRKIDGPVKNKGCVIWKLVWSGECWGSATVLVTRNVKQKSGGLVSLDFAVLGSVKWGIHTTRC